MRAGQYRGADGDLRTWEVTGPIVQLRLVGMQRDYNVRVEDLRAAAVALVALADELETVYIYVDPGDGAEYRLVLRGDDPITLEYRRTPHSSWESHPAPWHSYLAGTIFRAGQERGQR